MHVRKSRNPETNSHVATSTCCSGPVLRFCLDILVGSSHGILEYHITKLFLEDQQSCTLQSSRRVFDLLYSGLSSATMECAAFRQAAFGLSFWRFCAQTRNLGASSPVDISFAARRNARGSRGTKCVKLLQPIALSFLGPLTEYQLTKQFAVVGCKLIVYFLLAFALSVHDMSPGNGRALPYFLRPP